jgi:hypothetical protein
LPGRTLRVRLPLDSGSRHGKRKLLQHELPCCGVIFSRCTWSNGAA